MSAHVKTLAPMSTEAQADHTKREVHGLSVQEVRNLIHQKHNTSLSDDDPMLMMVTIYDAVLQKTVLNLDSSLNNSIDQFTQTVGAALTPITEQALKGQIETHLAKMLEVGKAVERFEANIKRFTLWLSFLAGVTCLVSILNIILMTQ